MSKHELEVRRLRSLEMSLRPLVDLFEKACPIGCDVHSTVVDVGGITISCATLRAADDRYYDVLMKLAEAERRLTASTFDQRSGRLSECQEEDAA